MRDPLRNAESPGSTPGATSRSLLAALSFFCILTPLFLLRPWREAMGLESGVDTLSRLFLVTALAALALQPLYGLIVNRVPRRVLAPTIMLGIGASLLGFAMVPGLLERGASDDVRRLTGQTFYVWMSLFNIFAVSVFWQLMADTHGLDDSKRRFGPIAIGGTLGAVIGSATTERFATALGPEGSFVLGAALFFVAGAALFLYARRAAIVTDHEHARQPPAWQGLADIARSPYLLAIVAYLAIYPLLSTFWYFTKLGLVEEAIADTTERAAFFGRVGLIAQLATLLVQAIVLGPLLRKLGTGTALAALPVFFAIGFGLLAFDALPALALIVFLDVARRVGNNGLAKPARDTLFTVVPRDQRYKAKNAIDTFVYRGSDAVGAVAWRAGMGTLAAPALAGVAIGACALWIAIAATLGRAQSRRATTSHT